MWYSRGYNDTLVKLGYDPNKFQHSDNPVGPDARATAGLGVGGAALGGLAGAVSGVVAGGKRIGRSRYLVERLMQGHQAMPDRWNRAATNMIRGKMRRRGLLGAALGGLAGVGLGLATTRHSDSYGE